MSNYQYEYEYESLGSDEYALLRDEYEYDNQSQVREPSRSRKRCYSAVLHAGWHEGSAAVAAMPSLLLLPSRKRWYRAEAGGKGGSAAIAAPSFALLKREAPSKHAAPPETGSAWRAWSN
jgi:hypothetical protein